MGSLTSCVPVQCSWSKIVSVFQLKVWMFSQQLSASSFCFAYASCLIIVAFIGCNLWVLKGVCVVLNSVEGGVNVVIPFR